MIKLNLNIELVKELLRMGVITAADIPAILSYPNEFESVLNKYFPQIPLHSNQWWEDITEPQYEKRKK